MISLILTPCHSFLNRLGLLVSFIAFLPFTQARGGHSSGRFELDIPLDLSSIDAATFSFCIIFAVFTFLLVLAAISRVKHRNNLTPGAPSIQYSVGHAYPILLLFATVSLLIFYILYSVYVGRTANQDFPQGVTNLFIAMRDFTDQLSDLLIVAALLAITSHRQHVLNVSSSEYRARKKWIDVSLIVISLVVIVVEAALGANVKTPSNLTSWFDIFHVYTTLYILATINVVASACIANSQLKRVKVEDAIIKAIIQGICPFLAARALFKLCDDVITSLPLEDVETVDFFALRLCRILVQGICYLFVVSVAVCIGDPPKPKSEDDASDRTKV